MKGLVYMNKDYSHVVCCGCRKSILIPRNLIEASVEDFERQVPGWIRTLDGMYCSLKCEEKGLPKRTRERVTAFPNFSKDVTFEFKVGAYDALAGFEALSDNEQYKTGYSAGEALRTIAGSLKAKAAASHE